MGPDFQRIVEQADSRLLIISDNIRSAFVPTRH